MKKLWLGLMLTTSINIAVASSQPKSSVFDGSDSSSQSQALVPIGVGPVTVVPDASKLREAVDILQTVVFHSQKILQFADTFEVFARRIGLLEPGTWGRRVKDILCLSANPEMITGFSGLTPEEVTSLRSSPTIDIDDSVDYQHFAARLAMAVINPSIISIGVTINNDKLISQELQALAESCRFCPLITSVGLTIPSEIGCESAYEDLFSSLFKNRMLEALGIHITFRNFMRLPEHTAILKALKQAIVIGNHFSLIEIIAPNNDDCKKIDEFITGIISKSTSAKVDEIRIFTQQEQEADE